MRRHVTDADKISAPAIDPNRMPANAPLLNLDAVSIGITAAVKRVTKLILYFKFQKIIKLKRR